MNFQLNLRNQLFLDVKILINFLAFFVSGKLYLKNVMKIAVFRTNNQILSFTKRAFKNDVPLELLLTELLSNL